jgi:hypothetical protein
VADRSQISEDVRRLWEALVIGAELDSYDYLLTEEMLEGYRAAVKYAAASYPTVAGRHAGHLWALRYPDGPKLLNAGQDSKYFCPPKPVTTIQVNGRIADKYERRGKLYVVVEADATATGGIRIEQSRLIGLLDGVWEVARREREVQ